MVSPHSWFLGWRQTVCPCGDDRGRGLACARPWAATVRWRHSRPAPCADRSQRAVLGAQETGRRLPRIGPCSRRRRRRRLPFLIRHDSCQHLSRPANLLPLARRELSKETTMHVLAKPFATLTAADLMTRDVVAIPEHMSLRTAARLLAGAQVTGAPVIDENGACVGVLSGSDFVRWADEGAPRRRACVSSC